MNKLLTIPLILFSSFTSAAPLYDTVINHGHVIDPLTGLDTIRHIGIEGDRIVNISEIPLSGEKSIDASGLIVAPFLIPAPSPTTQTTPTAYPQVQGSNTFWSVVKSHSNAARWSRPQGRVKR